MSGVNLKVDDKSNAIQVLAPDDATSVNGTSGGSSVRLALPANCKVVEIWPSAGVHWTFGNSSVTADTSDKYANGPAVYKVPDDATHVAFITVTGGAAAIVSVTRLY